MGDGIVNILRLIGVSKASAESVSFVMGIFTGFIGNLLYFRARYEATKVGGIVSTFIKVLIVAIVICAGIFIVGN